MMQRFNGTEKWSTLSAKQQRAIGALALEFVAASVASEDSDSAVIRRATRSNQPYISEALTNCVRVALPKAQLEKMLPSVIGGVCRVCGCTEYDACAGGCSWAADDLCSECKP